MSQLIDYAAILPHPPLIVPEVGRGDEEKVANTKKTYEKITESINLNNPDRVLLISSHIPMYKDAFVFPDDKSFKANFRQFGDVYTDMTGQGDREFLRVLMEESVKENLPCFTANVPEADHGTAVPMYYLKKAGGNFPIIRIPISGLSYDKHIKLGKIISKSLKRVGGKTAIIASGDLSHCLLKSGPYGYTEEGPIYDDVVMKDLISGDILKLKDYDRDLIDGAAECGHRCFLIMGGILEDYEINTLEHSYEGPFGVGYGSVLYEVK